MCILSFYPADVQPDETRLSVGAENNPDGHGFAIVDRHRIIVQRSMDSAWLIDRFMKLRRKYPAGPALFHSRIATAGAVDTKNCHPFPVGRDQRTVVAHNGILPLAYQPAKGDLRSDTRILADTDLPLRVLDSRKSMRRLRRVLGGDKLVILTVHPRWRSNAYVLNQERGNWVGGVWYSNTSHSAYYYRGGGYDYGSYATLTEVPCQGCDGKSFTGWCKDCRDAPDFVEPTVKCAFPGCNVYLLGATRCSVHKEGTLTPDRYGRGVTRSDLPCLYCGVTGSVSIVTMVCTACDFCQDCGEQAPVSCLCYTPAQLDRDPADLDRYTGTDDSRSPSPSRAITIGGSRARDGGGLHGGGVDPRSQVEQ